MKNKLKGTFASLFLVFTVVLNACTTTQAAPVTSSSPAASATPPAATTSAASSTPDATASPSALSAILSEVTGRVEIKQIEEDVFTPANINSFLDANGQVQTGDDGRVRLDLSTGTIIRIAPASLFTLISNEPAEESLKTRLELTLGKLFIILNGGSMEVETPTGTAAVRGSYMSVNYDTASGQIKITCLEGNCSLNNAGGRVEITAGQTAVITGGGQPPLVGEMSDEDIQDWLDNNPEAQLVVSALIDEQPTQIIPTKAVINQPSIYVPPATKKPTETKEPQPIITQTAMPSLVPTVTISSVDPAGSVVGEPLNITINVISSPDGPPPTGAVKVFANGSPICIAALDVEGFAFCTGGIPSVGNFNLVASYLGDTNYITAQSAVWSNYAVAKASTTVTITSHVPNPSLLSDPITFTATVDNVAPGAGTPFGSVTFADGAYNCIATSAPWTCSFTPMNPGPGIVIASYSGDANFNSSNSASIIQEVLLTSDTEFRNASGPVSTIAVCDQLYKIDVLDVNDVTSVYVEYSINDNTFSSPGTFLLTKTGAFTWEATHLIATIATDTVSWRFVATDGGSNQFFFGGSTPYFPGTLLVDFYSYDSTIACP